MDVQITRRDSRSCTDVLCRTHACMPFTHLSNAALTETRAQTHDIQPV